MCVYGDVVYAQTWQGMTLKNCMEPFSYTSTAYVVASALVSVQLFCKHLGNLQKCFGQMVYRPPWQKIARTPMSPAAKSGEKKLFSQARIWSLGIQLQKGSPTLYIWQSKWVGIIAIRTERTQIHFLSDVIVAVGSYQTLIIAHDHPRDHPRTYTVYQGARHSTRSNARN